MALNDDVELVMFLLGSNNQMLMFNIVSAKFLAGKVIKLGGCYRNQGGGVFCCISVAPHTCSELNVWRTLDEQV